MTWIQTYTGRAFSLLNPRAEDVAIDDIAHHLSKLCRFTGATSQFYSVAQHSIHVAELVPTEHKLAGLLHDAHEAYLGDWSAPLKVTLRLMGIDIDPLVERVNRAIGERFGVDLVSLPDEVKHADLVMLATEKRDIMADEPKPWILLPDPRDEELQPFSGYWNTMDRFVTALGRYHPGTSAEWLEERTARSRRAL